jgi:CheY-like chemotaxis protein
MTRSRSAKAAPKILIADDDPCVLRAVADRCTRMGFDVETASNGLQALIKAGQHRPDILVIDVHMPEVDGISVLTYLPETAQKFLHVIVVTGHPGQGTVEMCKGLNAACIAGSTGRRNTGAKSLCWGFKLQGLTWPFVELTSHFVQIGLRVQRQVGALWKVLSQQAIGVLIRPALPRALRIAKINVDVGRQRKSSMIRKFLAPVPGQRLVQFAR